MVVRDLVFKVKFVLDRFYFVNGVVWELFEGGLKIGIESVMDVFLFFILGEFEVMNDV